MVGWKDRGYDCGVSPVQMQWFVYRCKGVVRTGGHCTSKPICEPVMLDQWLRRLLENNLSQILQETTLPSPCEDG